MIGKNTLDKELYLKLLVFLGQRGNGRNGGNKDLLKLLFLLFPSFPPFPRFRPGPATCHHNGSHEMGAFLSWTHFITRNHSLIHTHAHSLLCKECFFIRPVTALLHASVVRCSDLAKSHESSRKFQEIPGKYSTCVDS